MIRRRREPVAFTVRTLLYLVYGLPLLWIVRAFLPMSAIRSDQVASAAR